MTNKLVKQKEIKGIIFDLDGTLSYTLDSIAMSANLALEAIGMKALEIDKYRYYCGDGTNELVRRVLRDSGDEKCQHFEELREKYLHYFSEYAEYNVRPYEGMPETISKLKEKGLKLGVLSNKPHKQCIEVVEKLYGKGTFDYIQGYTEAIRRKPSPDGALLVAKELGIEVSEILYVGDTATDMNTGNSAGMTTIGVLWGYRDEAELKSANADYIIKKPQGILEKLK